MRTLLSLVAVGLLLLASDAYPAEQDDSVEKARASFDQGVELYKDRKFEEALGAFQKAYQIKPTYRLLYNIGRTYFELHDYVNAYRTLGDYVDQAGEEISDGRRAQVDELNQKLGDHIASLTIACNVGDAELRIDGTVVGKSPLTSPVLVNPGSRRISAVLSGYALATRTVTLTDGEKATVRIELSVLRKTAASEPPPTPAPQRALEWSSPPRPAAAATRRPTLGAGFIVGLTAASGCAIATGIFAWQMAIAKDDFDRESGKSPYDRTAIEDARSRARTYQYLTWGFASATLISGGAALYLALSGDRVPARSRGPRGKHALLLTPTRDGLLLNGAW